MPLLFHFSFIEIGWKDIADVLLVSFLLYELYKVVRGNVAFRIIVGFVSIYLAYVVVKALKMTLLTAILGQFAGVGVLATIIIFQQEIRRFLLVIGKSTSFNRQTFLSGFFRRRDGNATTNLTPVIDACKAMTGNGTGALVVFSRSSDLKLFEDSGDAIDATISKRLLLAIFNKHSPLHDGAVIISGDRLVAARCILPVSDLTDLPAQFGLRHRAAIGLSEVTDAIVLIVSEETGQIALAHNGVLDHNLSYTVVKQRVNSYLSHGFDTGSIKDKIHMGDRIDNIENFNFPVN